MTHAYRTETKQKTRTHKTKHKADKHNRRKANLSFVQVLVVVGRGCDDRQSKLEVFIHLHVYECVRVCALVGVLCVCVCVKTYSVGVCALGEKVLNNVRIVSRDGFQKRCVCANVRVCVCVFFCV